MSFPFLDVSRIHIVPRTRTGKFYEGSGQARKSNRVLQATAFRAVCFSGLGFADHVPASSETVEDSSVLPLNLEHPNNLGEMISTGVYLDFQIQVLIKKTKKKKKIIHTHFSSLSPKKATWV